MHVRKDIKKHAAKNRGLGGVVSLGAIDVWDSTESNCFGQQGSVELYSVDTDEG